MIKLRPDIIFEDPFFRIQEYCAIEIYAGYDDKHNINNEISKRDIDAANKLYAMIDRYDKGESRRLLRHSSSISTLLSAIPDTSLLTIVSEEWLKLRRNIRKLLAEFLSIKGIGLAKTTKILHLKRPSLFPVLDSLLIAFLLQINISDVQKRAQLDIGLRALEEAQRIMMKQKPEFERLSEQTTSLPIPLTPVRIFDILCWTAEKWDIRGKLNAPYGVPSKSLLSSPKSKKDIEPDVEKVEGRGRYVVFEDLERATDPKVHSVDCFYYKRWLTRPTTTTTWHGPYESEEKAWEVCKRLSLRGSFKPSKHNCVK